MKSKGLMSLLCIAALSVGIANARTPRWICDNADVCPDGTTSVTGGGVDNPKGKFDEGDYNRQRLLEEWAASGSPLSFEDWLDGIIDGG